MQTARRLYIYVMAGIGLAVLVNGITLLLTVALESIGFGDALVLSGEQSTRERLTLAAATTAVALPVWLIHWTLAERSVRPDRPDAELERSSTVRGLYFALVLGGLLAAAAVSATALIEETIMRLLGASPAVGGGLAGDIGLAITAFVAWGYHLSVRLRDWQRGPLTGGGGWLPRTYLYVATFVGLFVLLVAVADLVGLVARILTGDTGLPSLGSRGEWRAPLASADARVIVGGAVWLGHWWYAGRLWSDDGVRGSMERSARLRFAYFAAVLVVSAAAAIAAGAELGRLALGALLGVEDTDGVAGSLPEAWLSSIVAVMLFAVTWFVHAAWLRRASGELDVPGWIRADRLIAYPTALVGLAFGAAGAARLIALVIDLLFGGGRVLSGADAAERVLAEYAPYALLGGAAWLWQWAAVRRLGAQDPIGEAASTVRRASLLIVLAASVLAGVASLGFILYRLFGAIFGLEAPGGSVVSELSLPIGVLAVAVVVAAYHARLLRSDGALRDVEEEPVAAPSQPEMALILAGPPGTEPGTLVGVADGLRAQLPDGFELRDDRRMS